MRAAPHSHTPPTSPSGEPLHPLLTRYLQHVRVEKRLAPRTLELYTLHLGDLQRRAHEAGTELAQVGMPHMRRWVAQLHSEGRQGRGIALVLSCWRGFYVWLGRQGLISANPCDGVRAPKAPQRLPKALGVDDAVNLAAFRQSPDTPGFDPWLEARDLAMVELLYGSGLRVSELTQLDVTPSREAEGWVDLDAAEVHVLGKGSKRRSVPVGSASLQTLKQWLEYRRGHAASLMSSALFTGPRGGRLSSQQVWQRVRLRSQQAGLPSAVHPHMLRHSFASHVLQSSGDLRAVQELLGHADIRTTQVYTRLDFQHLAKVYDQAHPRARRTPDVAQATAPPPAPTTDTPAPTDGQTNP